MNHCKYILLYTLLSLIVQNFNATAQFETVTSQYMNHQIMYNPAYAGMHNALSMSLSSRKQWLGIDGAPSSYSFAMHSPINKSYASLGGTIQRFETGPIQTNLIDFMYSYLVKFNAPVMLSLGLSGGVMNTAVGLANLGVNDLNDPYLNQNIDNGWSPNFGFGAYLYTPTLYVGVSAPKILQPQFKNSDGIKGIYKTTRTYYLSGGYTYKMNKQWSLKPSFLMRYASKNPISADFGGQLQYRNTFWVGATYRTNQTAVILLNINFVENLGICYSFDFPVNQQTYYKQGSHEISLVYDIFAFYKRTKYRKFPKKSTEPDEGMKSMRFF